jgi:hypothetical protein
MTRNLSTWAGILLFAGCTNHMPVRGDLAPAATQMLGSGPYSKCTTRHDGLRGCWANAGDTISYMYQDPTGQVLAVGQYWRVAPATAIAVFDSLLAELNSSRASETARKCDREDTAWKIRDRRSMTARSFSAVVLATPKVDLQVSPYIQRVTQTGAAECEGLYPLPLPR